MACGKMETRASLMAAAVRAAVLAKAPRRTVAAVAAAVASALYPADLAGVGQQQGPARDRSDTCVPCLSGDKGKRRRGRRGGRGRGGDGGHDNVPASPDVTGGTRAPVETDMSVDAVGNEVGGSIEGADYPETKRRHLWAPGDRQAFVPDGPKHFKTMEDYLKYKNEGVLKGQKIKKYANKDSSCGSPQVSAAVSMMFRSTAMGSAGSAAAALVRGSRVRIAGCDDVVGVEGCFGRVIEQGVDGRVSIELDDGQHVYVKLENIKACLFQ